MPKFQLPRFGGNPLEWLDFWAIFRTSVHEADMDDVIKYSFLRTQVYGAAHDAIDGLPLTADNYKVAIEILQERFQKQPEQQMGLLYSMLKKLPASNMQMKNLRHTNDRVTALVRRLKDHGENVDANHSLNLLVCSKFPPQVIKEIFKHRSVGMHSTVTELRNAIQAHIQETGNLEDLLEEMSPYGNDMEKPQKSSASTAHQRQDRQPSRTDGYSSGEFNKSGGAGHPGVPSSTMNAVDVPKRKLQKKEVTNPCCFCGEMHFHSECPVYSTADARCKRLESLGRCTSCSSSRHKTADCTTPSKRIRCYYCKTSEEHPSPLCPVQFASAKGGKKTGAHFSTTRDEATASPLATPTSSASALAAGEGSLLSTAVANISNPLTGVSCRARILLDNGSQRSYVTEKLASRLSCREEKRQMLSVSIFGTKNSLSVPSSEVEISIQMKDGSSKVIRVSTTRMITRCDLTPENLPEEAQKLIKTMEYQLADDYVSVPGPPDVLIGVDYFWELFSGNVITTTGGLYLIPTKLGVVLGGRYKEDREDQHAVLLCLTENKCDVQFASGLAAISSESRSKQSYPDIDEFWSLEKMGIIDSPTATNDDEAAMRIFNNTVRLEDNRYQLCWPWNDRKNELPTNYAEVLGRLRSVGKRLMTTDTSIRPDYNGVFQDQNARGVVERVPLDEINSTTNTVHYLAHHPVVRIGHSTTKVRVVFDASAKCRKSQASLNECMYRGPILMPDLCSILIRFRLHAVALVSDIEKAFLQLALQPSERDATRFLWFEDPDNMQTSKIEVWRFKRVPFGVIASPFLLQATNSHHLAKYGTQTSNRIAKNIYVDNVITGVASLADALPFYDEAKKIFADPSMNLREWCSNSTQLMDRIPIKDRCSSRSVKVLGIRWDSEADTLQLQGNWDGRINCYTKRDVLRAVASIYDPLGLFQPCTLRTKCFLRDLWNAALGWDDPIDEALQQRWASLHADIRPIFNVLIPRYLPPGPSGQVSLVVFADASGDAYATAVYLRTREVGSTVWTADLVFAKSRLAPKLKQGNDIKIPRLELLGLLIASFATSFVRQSLQLSSPVYAFLLTDSSCVMGWLKSDKPLPTFVNNRVKQIRKLEDVEFHHVRTNDNPADIATRGLRGCEIGENKMWWHGPEWLKQDHSEWPTKSAVDVVTSEQLQQIEMKIPADLPIYHSLAAPEGRTATTPAPSYPFGLEPKKYSSWRKLLRITAWMLKFVRIRLWNNLSAISQQQKTGLQRLLDPVTSNRCLTAADIRQAKMMWIKTLQDHHFEEVREAITLSKQHQLVAQLNLQIDDEGVIRSGGRLRYAQLPDSAVQPILLPKNDPVTSLVIRDVHGQLFHSGVSHTLSQVRREFWIPHGRNVVRKVLTRCNLCRKNKGPPFALPDMPPWPRDRMSKSAPFSFTGMDYIGPVNVSVNGEVQKMWICLMTCLTVRAVHLEYVTDCTAQSFIDCLVRFIGRRGRPVKIITDNAPQFRVAKTLLDRTWASVLRDETVLSYMADNNIEWKFTTELAPWQGGVYERLVSIFKSTFRSAVGRRLLKFDQFFTHLVEIEAIINSRPITYVYSDVHSGMALRPIDFLIDLQPGTPPVDPTIKPEGGEASKLILRHWKYKQKRLDEIWSVWQDEYLKSMRERSRVSHPKGRSDVLSHPDVNEVVLIHSPDLPRGWKLGKITQLLVGSDGATRSAELLLPNRLTIRRPLNHLYRLEIPKSLDDVQLLEDDQNQQQHQDDGTTEDDRPPPVPLAEAPPDDDGVFDDADVDETEQLIYRFGRPPTVDDAGNRQIAATNLALSQQGILDGLKTVAVPVLFAAGQ